MTERRNPRPIVIDTDPGIDDALAITLALRSPELRVELMTTVAGNTGLRAATDNARRLLALLDHQEPPRLVPGAARPLRGRLNTAPEVHGDDGLAGLSGLRDRKGRLLYPASRGPLPDGGSAADAIVAKARERGHELAIVALGPLTNIARALEADADAMRRVGRLIVMGGAIEAPGNVTAAAEFNFHVDPVAADRVLTSGMRITLVALDVTRRVRLRWPLVQGALRGDRSPLARALRHFTRPLASGREGMPLHDPLATALAIDPGLVRTRPLPVRVETMGVSTRGMSVADRRTRQRAAGAPGGDPAANAAGDQPRLVDVAFEVDAGRVLALVAERVFGTGPQIQGRHGAEHPAESAADVVVIGSANTDLTVTLPALPRPGETVTGGVLSSGFGGKGANQAVAARRAGAEVAFATRMGDDEYADRYLDHLRTEGIDTGAIGRDRRAASGVALIVVDAAGRNQIAVASGANARLRPAHLKTALRRVRAGGVVVAQLEVPVDTVVAAFRAARRAGAATLLNPTPVPAEESPVVVGDAPAAFDGGPVADGRVETASGPVPVARISVRSDVAFTVPATPVHASAGAHAPARASSSAAPAPAFSPASSAPVSVDEVPASSSQRRVRRLPETLVGLTDVVVVNAIEAEQLAGLPVDGLAPAHRAAQALVAAGFKAAVVTLGERGAVWSDGTAGGHVPAPEVRVVDTVGAGDTFTGYLAAGLARGAPLAESVAEAVRAATLAVTRRGAQPGIPQRSELSPKGSEAATTP